MLFKLRIKIFNIKELFSQDFSSYPGIKFIPYLTIPDQQPAPATEATADRVLAQVCESPCPNRYMQQNPTVQIQDYRNGNRADDESGVDSFARRKWVCEQYWVQNQDKAHCHRNVKKFGVTKRWLS